MAAGAENAVEIASAPMVFTGATDLPNRVNGTSPSMVISRGRSAEALAMKVDRIPRVGDIIDEKSEELVWISPLESVFDALKLMNERNVGAVLVQIDGYLVGILTERDYMRKVILNIHASKQTKVSEVMSRDVITVTRDDTIVHCIALTKKHHIRHLPVVEDGKPIGMISLRDLFLEAIDEKFGPDAEDQ